LRGVTEVDTLTGSSHTARAEARGSGQERGKEWEYRVIAVNKAGQGTSSNTVMAVL